MDVISQAVDNLVTQFSSAYDFYRELVQNSIDAGSAAIEVWLDYLPGEDGASGMIEIHVDDAGEGMDEEVIDKQLTTLFSSSKENDLTKIGKFGIGFVSVFALGPEAVLIQTGRSGEYWEILFHADRSFSKARIEAPVEGTQLTLFLPGDRARYTEVVSESRRTLDHWCRHSEAEVSFEDRASGGEIEAINRPFEVEGECMCSVEVEGTQMALAFKERAIWGFYNRGLALAVGHGKSELAPARFAHVSFRIKSRYLEHTLSRETVMRDANYHKAMAQLEAAASGALRARLVDALRELAGTPGRLSTAQHQRYFQLLGFLVREGEGALANVESEPLLRTLDGGVTSLAKLREHGARDGRIYVREQTTALVERLLEQGTPVVVCASGGSDPVQILLNHAMKPELLSLHSLRRFVDELRGEQGPERLVVRPEDVLVAVEVADDDPGAKAFVADVDGIMSAGLADRRGLLKRAYSRVLKRGEGSPPVKEFAKMVCARLSKAPGARLPLFVVAHEVAPLMALPLDGVLDVDDERPEVAINCEHPRFRALRQVWERDRGIGAYCLARELILARRPGLSGVEFGLLEAAQALG